MRSPKEIALADHGLVNRGSRCDGAQSPSCGNVFKGKVVICVLLSKSYAL